MRAQSCCQGAGGDPQPWAAADLECHSSGRSGRARGTPAACSLLCCSWPAPCLTRRRRLLIITSLLGALDLTGHRQSRMLVSPKCSPTNPLLAIILLYPWMKSYRSHSPSCHSGLNVSDSGKSTLKLNLLPFKPPGCALRLSQARDARSGPGGAASTRSHSALSPSGPAHCICSAPPRGAEPGEAGVTKVSLPSTLVMWPWPLGFQQGSFLPSSSQRVSLSPRADLHRDLGRGPAADSCALWVLWQKFLSLPRPGLGNGNSSSWSW